MELKLLLNLAQKLLIGLEQADPDESVFVFELFADVGNRYICHADTIGVGRAIDDTWGMGRFC